MKSLFDLYDDGKLALPEEDIEELVLIPLKSGQGYYASLKAHRPTGGLNPFEIRARVLLRHLERVKHGRRWDFK